MKRRIILTILSCLVFSGLFWAANSYALTLYVNGATGVDGPGHGTSPADPFKTIKYALNQAPEGTTISVASGNYNESPIITKNLITLKGAGRATTSINGNGTVATIQIIGPVRVTIRGFSITGGKWGILCEFAHLISSYNTIKNNLSDGLVACRNSHLTMENTNVTSNSLDGVRIVATSFAQIENSTISGNQGNGLSIHQNSSATCIANKIRSNHLRGIQIWLSSSAYLKGNVISGNEYEGLEVTIHSSAQLETKNKIHDNADNSGWKGGISILHNSTVEIECHTVLDEDKDQIYANHGPGIFVNNNGYLFLWSGKVYGNEGDGVSLRGGAGAQFEEGAGITNNSGWGYSCDGTNAIVNEPGVNSGNGAGATNCP